MHDTRHTLPKKHRLVGMGVPIINLRQPPYRLWFAMGMPFPVRRHRLVDRGPKKNSTLELTALVLTIYSRTPSMSKHCESYFPFSMVCLLINLVVTELTCGVKINYE